MRRITGTLTEPDFDAISGRFLFIAEQSTASIPATSTGTIAVTDGTYDGEIAEGVYTVVLRYMDSASGSIRNVSLGRGVVVIPGDPVDIFTLVGLSDVPTPLMQAAIDEAIDDHESATDPHDQYAKTDDGRLSDDREWTADTVTQEEAEAGAATTRRAWTALRVFQAAAAWWAGSSDKTKLDGIEANANNYSLEAHALGGAAHSADTLANLNLKVSDATLDDSSAARTPTAHKATHETGAADALAPADIGAEPAFSKNTGFNKDFGSAAGTVTQGNDSRLSDAREWAADTVTQAQAEAGTGTTRRAWTVQRVWQAIAKWAADNLGTMSTQDADNVAITGGNIGIDTVDFVSEYDNGTVTTNTAIDWNNGNNQIITIGADITLSFDNIGIGHKQLRVLQDATGGWTPILPAGKWPGGTTGSFSTDANAEDILSIFYNGVDYYYQLMKGWA